MDDILVHGQNHKEHKNGLKQFYIVYMELALPSIQQNVKQK